MKREHVLNVLRCWKEETKNGGGDISGGIGGEKVTKRTKKKKGSYEKTLDTSAQRGQGWGNVGGGENGKKIRYRPRNCEKGG